MKTSSNSLLNLLFVITLPIMVMHPSEVSAKEPPAHGAASAKTKKIQKVKADDDYVEVNGDQIGGFSDILLAKFATQLHAAFMLAGISDATKTQMLNNTLEFSQRIVNCDITIDKEKLPQCSFPKDAKSVAMQKDYMKLIKAFNETSAAGDEDDQVTTIEENANGALFTAYLLNMSYLPIFNEIKMGELMNRFNIKAIAKGADPSIKDEDDNFKARRVQLVKLFDAAEVLAAKVKANRKPK